MSIYDFKPDRHSSHRKIIRHIIKLNKKGLRILDIGCSKGFIGKQLSKNNEFYGIEISKDDAKIAKKYYKKIIIADLDRAKPKYKADFFDAIIMTDVIEHLKDPIGTMAHFKKFLKDDGIMIISVPNVANTYVRLKLLFGNFDYETRGILDNTHLRFFTLKSFRAALKKAGLIIIKEEATPVPFQLVNPIFSQKGPLSFLYHAYYLLVLAWKKMFAFQFIAYCVKQDEN